MKRFLFLGLIYTLNILMFLFAKSAGASVSGERLEEMKMVKSNISRILADRRPAVITKLVVKR